MSSDIGADLGYRAWLLQVPDVERTHSRRYRATAAACSEISSASLGVRRMANPKWVRVVRCWPDSFRR